MPYRSCFLKLKPVPDAKSKNGEAALLYRVYVEHDQPPGPDGMSS